MIEKFFTAVSLIPVELQFALLRFLQIADCCRLIWRVSGTNPSDPFYVYCHISVF